MVSARDHLHRRAVRVIRHDGLIDRVRHGTLDYVRFVAEFYRLHPEQASATVLDDEGCPPDCRCRSRRWIDRLRTWRDNSAWHHRHIANGPLWWACGDCRAVQEPERLARARVASIAALSCFGLLAILRLRSKRPLFHSIAAYHRSAGLRRPLGSAAGVPLAST